MKQYLGSEEEGPDGKVYYKLGACYNIWGNCRAEVPSRAANLDDRIKNPDQLSAMRHI